MSFIGLSAVNPDIWHMILQCWIEIIDHWTAILAGPSMLWCIEQCHEHHNSATKLAIHQKRMHILWACYETGKLENAVKQWENCNWREDGEGPWHGVFVSEINGYASWQFVCQKWMAVHRIYSLGRTLTCGINY